jgi:predicted DsbA family dithiol-disulfide isomerase
MSNATSGVLEVFADVGCPFTHLGLLRFVEERRRRGRTDVVLRVRAWPLELVNGTPLDATFIAEEVDDIRSQVAPDSFRAFAEEAFPASTVPAMCLAAAAADAGPHTAERVALALRAALFEDGLDVGDDVVLATIAADHDLVWPPSDADRDRLIAAVRADWDEGRGRGVIGSPHFFFTSGDGFFCPALDVGRDEHGHLRVHADPEGFARFLDEVFSRPADD